MEEEGKCAVPKRNRSTQKRRSPLLAQQMDTPMKIQGIAGENDGSRLKEGGGGGRKKKKNIKKKK